MFMFMLCLSRRSRAGERRPSCQQGTGCLIEPLTARSIFLAASPSVLNPDLRTGTYVLLRDVLLLRAKTSPETATAALHMAGPSEEARTWARNLNNRPRDISQPASFYARCSFHVYRRRGPGPRGFRSYWETCQCAAVAAGSQPAQASDCQATTS